MLILIDFIVSGNTVHIFVKILLPVMAVFFLAGCSECENCDSYDKEPFVSLQFYRKAGFSPSVVAITEINRLDATLITNYQDTTNAYILPLSITADLSAVVLTYSPGPDYTQAFTDSLIIAYERQFIRNEKNYVDVISRFTEVLESSFDSIYVVCTDTLGICNSNETTIKVYF